MASSEEDFGVEYVAGSSKRVGSTHPSVLRPSPFTPYRRSHMLARRESLALAAVSGRSKMLYLLSFLLIATGALLVPMMGATAVLASLMGPLVQGVATMLPLR
jgi:hypothetical protein